MLVRRAALERLGGWDEGFFLYSEDMDLCRRLWALGYEVRYDRRPSRVHVGGGSAPRAALLPVLAAKPGALRAKAQSPAGRPRRACGRRARLADAHGRDSKGAADARGHCGALRAACLESGVG